MHLSVAQLRLQASIYFSFVFEQLLNSDCSVSVSVSLLVEFISQFQQVQAGLIAPQFCPTVQMPADILTKALPHPEVAEMRALLGLQD